MENRFLTCHEESVIQTQKSGFKAATIRVKSAHWGGDWIFFFWGVIERFQNLRQVCSRNSLLVQFLCCFTKQSPRIYHENQNKEAKKKTTITAEDVLSYEMLSTVAIPKRQQLYDLQANARKAPFPHFIPGNLRAI